MRLTEAFAQGDIDRFEMMMLATTVFALQQKRKWILSLDDIDFQKGKGFSFAKVIPLPKTKGRRTVFLRQMKRILGRRLTSIFLNHLFALDARMQLSDFLTPVKGPFLVACGGFSGSGKSRVAREMAPFVAPAWGCFIVRDDVVRKQMASVDLTDTLDETFYTPENEKKVYARMRQKAKSLLQKGFPVILDALFYNPAERKKAESLAKRLNVPFVGLWLEAPLDVRAERVEKRLNNPSDVKSKKVLEEQLKKDLGKISWSKIFTHKDKDKTVQNARKVLKKHLKKH